MHFANLPSEMLDATNVHGKHREYPKPAEYERVIKFYRNQLYPIGHIDEQIVRDIYHLDIKPKLGHVTILFLENESVDVVKLTPWMVCHRMGHVLYQTMCHEDNGQIIPILKNFSKVFDENFRFGYRFAANRMPMREPSRHELAWFFGTTRTCREATMRQNSELWYECFTQFCITGRVRFNTPKFIMNHRDCDLLATPGISIDDFSRQLTVLAAKMERHFRWKFQASAGQIYAF